MKKTLTINLAGLVFHIDEDAYNKLKEYLENIESHISDENESREIIRDVEARIAEILTNKKKDNRQVVTLSDIDGIITVMGQPNDFAGDKEEEEKASHTFTQRNYRRMYRDPDHRIIGGVCSGLGAYWSIDPSLIRIVFIVLAIVGMAGILIYLILWIVLPEARTVAQKLEMRGEPVNVSSIRDFIKNEYNNVKNSMHFNYKTN